MHVLSVVIPRLKLNQLRWSFTGAFEAKQSLIVRGIFPMLADPRHPSYGGFCAVTYLSFAPEGLKSVLLTGGLPPIGKDCTADTVYRACFEQVIHQNEKYYKRFPQDIPVVIEVVKYLAGSEGGGVPLPSGGILTPKGLQLLGLAGLGSGGGFERLHYLLERVWDPILVPGAQKHISYYFLKAFESWLDFDTNPLYALMHESIYCQGASSQWSAQKIRDEYDSVFDPIKAAIESHPVYFTGEWRGICSFLISTTTASEARLAHIRALKIYNLDYKRVMCDIVEEQRIESRQS